VLVDDVPAELGEGSGRGNQAVKREACYNVALRPDRVSPRWCGNGSEPVDPSLKGGPVCEEVADRPGRDWEQGRRGGVEMARPEGADPTSCDCWRGEDCEMTV